MSIVNKFEDFSLKHKQKIIKTYLRVPLRSLFLKRCAFTQMIKYYTPSGRSLVQLETLYVCHICQHLSPLHMFEKAVTQANILTRPLNQSRGVCHWDLPQVSVPDVTYIGVEGSERESGDGWLCFRYTG